METSERVKITMSNATIKKYKEQMEDLRSRLQRLAGKYGAHYIFIRSDGDLLYEMLHGFSGIMQKM